MSVKIHEGIQAQFGSYVCGRYSAVRTAVTNALLLLQDRVECSSTQMAEVAQLAEQETRTSNRTTRVVGWYHSHPHITALPSHIDVQTQARSSIPAPVFSTLFGTLARSRSPQRPLSSLTLTGDLATDTPGGYTSHHLSVELFSFLSLPTAVSVL